MVGDETWGLLGALIIAAALFAFLIYRDKVNYR